MRQIALRAIENENDTNELENRDGEEEGEQFLLLLRIWDTDPN